MANLLKIKELARVRNISLKQLAEDVGISEQALHQLMRKNTTAIATLEAIATKLEVSPSTFFEDVGDAGAVNQSVMGEGNTKVAGNGNHIDVAHEAIAALRSQLDVKDGQIDKLLGILANAGR